MRGVKADWMVCGGTLWRFGRMLAALLVAMTLINGAADAQNYAADEDDVLQGPRPAYGVLRGPPIDRPYGSQAGESPMPPEYGSGDRSAYPGYGGHDLTQGGSSSNYAPRGSVYPGSQSGYAPLSDDGESAYRSRFGASRQDMERLRRDDDERAVSQIEQQRTQRAIDLQRQYNMGHTSRQTLDSATIHLLQQSNEAIAQQRRGLSR